MQMLPKVVVTLFLFMFFQDPETGITYGQKFCSILHENSIDSSYPGLYIGTYEKIADCDYPDYGNYARSAFYEICCTPDGMHDPVCAPPEEI